MEVVPLSANQRCILEAVVSGQVGIFSRPNLSRLVTSMWECRTLAKWVTAYVQPLPHFKRIHEVSLPDFIICSKDRELNQTSRNSAETGNWFWESLAITIKLRNVNDKIAVPPQTNMSCRTNMSEQFQKVTLCNIINFCLISFLHVVWLSLPSCLSAIIFTCSLIVSSEYFYNLIFSFWLVACCWPWNLV